MLCCFYLRTMDNEKEEKKPKKKEEKDFRSSLSDAYKSLDQELVKEQKQDILKKQEIIEEGIEKVEKESGKELISSKLLTSKILDLRKKAGMPEAIGTAGRVKAPILFKKDEFKQKLTRELLIIGTEELADIGCAITIANLVDYFRETRSNWKVRTGEILEVLKVMEKKEVIPPRVEIGENEVLIRFKPIEMSGDIQDILRLATGLSYLTVDKVISHLGWPIERAQSTLTVMMKMDLAILEETTGNYYFPGIG